MTPDGRMGRLDRETLHYVECLARKISRKLPTHVDRDDIQQAAKLAAVQAALGFDEGGGVPFTAYLTVRVRGAINDHLRGLDFATRGARARITAARNANDDYYIDPALLLALDVIPDAVLTSDTPTPEQIALLTAAWDTVRQAIAELPPRQRAAILCDGQRGDINRAATEMGITPGRVSQLRSAGAKRLRAHLRDCAITRSDFDRQP